MIIRSMPSIDAASVLLDTETKRPFGGEMLKTGSVNVKAAGTESINDSQVEAIGCLVTAAVAGLKPECVTVIDINTGRVYHPRSENGGLGSEDTYLMVQRKFEEKYKRDVLNALSFIPNIAVQTSVTLNPKKFQQKVEFTPNKGVPIQHNEKSHSSAKDGSAAVPAVAPVIKPIPISLPLWPAAADRPRALMRKKKPRTWRNATSPAARRRERTKSASRPRWSA